MCVCLFVGFTSARTVTLTNTSDVTLTFHAHVPDDGSGPSLCFDKLATVQNQSDDDAVCEEPPPGGADVKPREFTVQPSCGVLEPRSDVTFTVTMCPNAMSRYSRELAVSFDQVANKTFTIPITAQYANRIYLVGSCSTV